MHIRAVVFGFFVVLAATLNFGFTVGDLDDPALHNVYERSPRWWSTGHDGTEAR
jgi:hypothetical protein